MRDAFAGRPSTNAGQLVVGQASVQGGHAGKLHPDFGTLSRKTSKTLVAGQMTQPNSVVFNIADPTRLWVEALSYEALVEVKNATARIGGKSLNLSFRGSGFADRNQSIPIHFAIEDHTSGLRAGQFVTMLATTDEERRGIAVPRDALVRSASGQDVVFEHVAAERFKARPVRV